MEIAKGITNVDFKKLKLEDQLSHDWIKAASIFEKRFSNRFIEPVDLLIKAEAELPAKDKKFGFTVMAIDCLLIETLACFYYGFIETPPGKNKSIYTKFLVDPETVLSKHFNSTIASTFYEDVRCGILHQSETKNAALIKARGPVVQKDSTGLKINRIKLHEVVKTDFYNYIEKIKDPANKTLRAHFRKKMNYICQL